MSDDPIDNPFGDGDAANEAARRFVETEVSLMRWGTAVYNALVVVRQNGREPILVRLPPDVIGDKILEIVGLPAEASSGPPHVQCEDGTRYPITPPG